MEFVKNTLFPNGIQKVEGSNPLSSIISMAYEGCGRLGVSQKVAAFLRLCKLIHYVIASQLNPVH